MTTTVEIKCKFHTTLQLLKEKNACLKGIETLLESLPENFNHAEPISLLHIVESNGLNDALWALRATQEEGADRVAKELAIEFAEKALPIFEDRYPDDKRLREAINAARFFLAGDITREQLFEARYAAEAAEAAAYAAYAAEAAFAAKSKMREWQEQRFFEAVIA